MSIDIFKDVPHCLADRVDEVLESPGRMAQLGEEARRDVVERYNVKGKIGEYQMLWEDVMGKR